MAFRGFVGVPVVACLFGDLDGLAGVLQNVIEEDRIVEHEPQVRLGVLAERAGHFDSRLVVLLGVLLVFVIRVDLGELAHLVGLALLQEDFVLLGVGHLQQLLVEDGEELFDQLAHLLLARLLLVLDQFRVVGFVEVF